MPEPLFPEVEQYIADTDMLNKLKGNQAQLYRILGQGKTKSKELDMPPAEIERKMELVAFKPLKNKDAPLNVRKEIDAVKQSLDSELATLKKRDVQKRLANQTLRSLTEVKSGNKDNCFFAGRLILVVDKAGGNWSWCLTPHYPIIAKIPPDPEYIAKSYYEAEKLLGKIIMPAEIFDVRLNLAWMLARRFSLGENVLIIDVARMYKVAGQPEKFWNTPKKGNFVDLPDAAFIANLINWRRQSGFEKTDFKLAQATVHQALGPKAKVFYMPSNSEGTQTRPVVYITKRS
ncbi:MAG: hypothetical protein HQ552_06960 [Desulfobacteraceae bacterium]|nr:hypothetical protein [Desulfobacteraceae bacterium]